MKITSKFTVAVHTLLSIYVFKDRYKTTSEFLAASVNVNPVVIRRTLQNLKAAGLVEVKAGSGGAVVTKPLNKISLYDVYKAVGCADDVLFHFHESPNIACPVGKNIHTLLDAHLQAAQIAMENSLRGVTLDTLARDYNKLTERE